MKQLQIAVWACLLTLCMMLPANAAPVVAAIGAIAGILKAGGLAATLIKFAFGVALQVGSSLLKKVAMKKQPDPGINGQVQLGGNKSLSFIVGTYATAGHLEYVNTHGRVSKTPNAVLTQVITVSDLPVQSIDNSLIVNGALCTRNTSTNSDGAAKFGATSYPIDQYKHDKWYFLFCKYYLGNNATADPNLVAAYNSHARPWSADMIGRGVAYVIATAEIQRKLMTAIPTFRFEVQGILLYDPRRDNSVGGSGAHRWGNEATYEWSDNPAVIIYNILRGIYYQGDYIYGAEIPAHNLPLTNWIAAMNECDLPVALEGGGSARQFRCGYEIKTLDNEPVDVIEELLKACNGRMAEIGGVYKIQVGAAPLPVAFINDQNFVVTEDQKLDDFHGLESTFNGVTATYPERTAGWEMKDAPQRRFPDFEAEDGNRTLLADVQFNAVPFAEQVQRLMKSLALENRRFRKIIGTLLPWASVLEPLDVISYTSARNGYDNKSFLLTAIDDQTNVNQTASLIEVDPSDYSWEPSSDTLPWSVGALVPVWPPAQVLTGWNVQPAALLDNNGLGRKPSIEVFFDGDMADVRAVRVQVRIPVVGTLHFDGELPYGDPDVPQKSAILNGLFSPNVTYEVRGRYIPFSGRDTEWSDWLTVKTPNILLGAVDLYPINVDQFDESYQQILRDEAANKRYLSNEIARISTILSEGMVEGSMQLQGFREQVSVEIGESRSEYRRLVLVEASERKALATRVEEVNAVLSGDIANVRQFAQSSVSEIDGRITAVSQSVTETQVQVGAISAGGYLRFLAEANQAGSLSRIVMTTSVTAGGAPVDSVFAMESTSTGKSRVIIDADGIFFTNRSARKRPFAFIDGKLYADELLVNWANIVNADIKWAYIENAVTNNFVAQTANIGNAIIKTSNLDFNQVTQSYFAQNALPPQGWAPATSTWEDLLTMTTNNSQANTSFVEVRFNTSVYTGPNITAGFMLRFINKTTGFVFMERVNTGGSAPVSLDGLFIDSGSAIGSNTYAVQGRVPDGNFSSGQWLPNSGGLTRALVWKR
ncbi:phage tail protein [Ochrobactrum sp. GRS2]|nr:phage tail protein [Ochrobactrum sp. GRS2]